MLTHLPIASFGLPFCPLFVSLCLAVFICFHLGSSFRFLLLTFWDGCSQLDAIACQLVICSTCTLLCQALELLLGHLFLLLGAVVVTDIVLVGAHACLPLRPLVRL